MKHYYVKNSSGKYGENIESDYKALLKALFLSHFGNHISTVNCGECDGVIIEVTNQNNLKPEYRIRYCPDNWTNCKC